MSINLNLEDINFEDLNLFVILEILNLISFILIEVAAKILLKK